MSPADLGVEGAAAWLRLLLGTAVLLLPGLAAADRLLPGRPMALIWSPVLSLTLLPLAAILLDTALGVPVTAASTAALAVGLAVLLGAPRLRSLFPEAA